MRWGLIALLPAFWAATSAADCPIGSYPWVDQWGTQICKRWGDGSAATTQGSLESCPPGTHPWVDQWGTRVCQSYSAPTQRSYDTSQGCPMGTYQWQDNWGNQVCKRF